MSDDHRDDQGTPLPHPPRTLTDARGRAMHPEDVHGRRVGPQPATGRTGRGVGVPTSARAYVHRHLPAGDAPGPQEP